MINMMPNGCGGRSTTI